ncbi:GPI-anchored protein LLG1-like [Lolium rigidum]|uniref:GPI-anchored protein LLG1-like n=1 Tax=Lolium rigidum TaxID=89674 RepID=UPI001F5E30CE|nr:GPI-anchored protein LLG1-like [Lolium rigidum]
MHLAFWAAVLAVALTIRVAVDGGDEATLLRLPPNGTAGRSLLQIKKNCPVNLETANYTEVTSRCRGPVYNESLCCAAFSDFACPYGAYINDMTTNCAATMLSYLRLYGRYPPGLFANTCKQDLRKGLRCLEEEISGGAVVGAAQVPPLVDTAFTSCVCILIIMLS